MDRTLLVTGGNRGIGLAIVQGLSENENDTVLLGCRNLKQGKDLAQSIGKNVIAVELDLSNQEQLNLNIEAILKDHSKIDVLVNNAGILIDGNLLEVSMKDIELSAQINSLAPIQLVKKIAPIMIRNNYGRIVNISSGWGSFGEGINGPFAYSTSKAFINALTKNGSLALTQNVKMNSMCPGWVRTDMGGANANRSPEEGAATALWLSNLPDDGPNGSFFRDKEQIEW